jgi:hypothetical protein
VYDIRERNAQEAITNCAKYAIRNGITTSATNTR